MPTSYVTAEYDHPKKGKTLCQTSYVTAEYDNQRILLKYTKVALFY